MIITISRQYAAGGSEVARQVAERLGYTLVDNELIDEVAARPSIQTKPSRTTRSGHVLFANSTIFRCIILTLLL